MDPIGDMLVKIKNASKAGHESVSFPYSKIKQEIATALSRAGFVGKVSKKSGKKNELVEVELVYTEGNSKINDINRVSKVSRRVYSGVSTLKSVANGRGAYVLSTPKGVMTDKEAKKEHVGGEVILSIW